MKRRWLLILVALLLIALAFFLFRSRLDSNAPRFVPVNAATITPGDDEQFDFMADAPFANDRMWIWTGIASRHPQLVLYDLRQKKILGQLLNGDSPSLSSRDGSRLLVCGVEAPASFRDRLFSLLRVIGIRLPGASQRAEVFWILDTSQNSAKKVGSLSQAVGAGSIWRSSPDFHYGYTMPTTTTGTALYLCDLEQASLRSIPIHGGPCGWWDDHDILINAGNNQFDLLDIKTETTRSLFSPGDFATLLASRATLTNSATLAGGGTATNAASELEQFFPTAAGITLTTMANWNGTNYDFYFADRNLIRGLNGSNSFVLRASVDSPKLEMLYPRFEFRWGGHFDRSGKRYLYPGESGAPGRGGNASVYLRDLTNGAVSTIAPPVDQGGYSTPRFYGNEVIYFHDRRLHRVGLDGSNDAVVLPSR
jgi:hypothetical protein